MSPRIVTSTTVTPPPVQGPRITSAEFEKYVAEQKAIVGEITEEYRQLVRKRASRRADIACLIVGFVFWAALILLVPTITIYLITRY